MFKSYRHLEYTILILAAYLLGTWVIADTYSKYLVESAVQTTVYEIHISFGSFDQIMGQLQHDPCDYTCSYECYHKICR